MNNCPKPWPFAKLRSKMRKEGAENADLAHVMKCSVEHVSRCLNLKAHFKDWQQYVVLDLLGVDRSKVYKFFPPGGYPPAKKNDKPQLFAVAGKKRTG